MVLMEGRALAEELFRELGKQVAQSGRHYRLAVVIVGEHPVIEKFVETKRRAGERIGIDVRVYRFPEAVSTHELRKRLAAIVHENKNSGVVVQLPLPPHIAKQTILNAVVPEKDVDVLSARAVGDFAVGKARVSPTIVGAIQELFRKYKIAVAGKRIAVLGAGALVGKPVMLWLLREPCVVSVVTEETENPDEILRRADIIISGIGKPGYITGDMVKDGVVVVDAGTSESEGKIRGDVDFDSVSKKASFLTPVPGGVGPVTVAMIFKNLVTLSERP